MAGSIVWRRYIDDTLAEWRFRVDRSNADATLNFTTGWPKVLMTGLTKQLPVLPTWLKKRYALAYSSTNPKIKRKFYIGGADVGDLQNVTWILLSAGAPIIAPDYPGANDAAGTNKTWIVTSLHGEKRMLVPPYNAADTGLSH